MLPHLRITAVKDKKITDFQTPKLKETNSLCMELKHLKMVVQKLLLKMRIRRITKNDIF